MWDRIFLTSLVVFFIGLLAVLAGEIVITGSSSFTLVVVGGSVAGLAGLIWSVSALVLIFTTDFSA
ncbi:MAG: hypothetical protein F4W95_13710 [Chloroflexi bacterium]|nr:hypothetical protein [Chloroflexota bacterium]MYD49519.1 hypothetical protein [Chloroflexota bacterium]